MATVIDFGRVNWGSDDAKGDDQLHNYFYRIPDYDNIIAGSKRYVIGRKGTGKTAILEKIRIDAQQCPEWFCNVLTLKEFPIANIRSFAEKSMQNKSKYVNIWMFLILIELSKICMKDEGINVDSYVVLRDFLKTNFPSDIGGFVHTIEVLKRRESKITILKGFFEGTGTREHSAGVEVHFSKVISTLKSPFNKSKFRLYIFHLI